jgi:hypothetical protein
MSRRTLRKIPKQNGDKAEGFKFAKQVSEKKQHLLSLISSRFKSRPITESSNHA